MKIRCNKCGKNKEATTENFLRDAHSKTGFRTPCKKCKGIKKTVGRGGPTPATENRYDRHLQSTRERQRRIRSEVIAAYGGKCECCGEAEPKFLVLDHTNGGGNAHRRQVGVASSFYAWLKREGYPKENLQLLCANCHTAKDYFGGCPHKKAGTKRLH